MHASHGGEPKCEHHRVHGRNGVHGTIEKERAKLCQVTWWNIMLVSFTVTIYLAGSLGKLFDWHHWKAICPAVLEGYLAGSLEGYLTGSFGRQLGR